MLQHGWPQHWWCWRKVIPPLAERYRVICPDLRGHGWSDAPEGGYGKPQFADDLIALLDELGLDRVRLIGHDWGGMAGFLACIRHPERFDRYLALSIAPPFPSGDPKELLGLWRLYYQIPLTLPFLAPRLDVAARRASRSSCARASPSRAAMTPRDVDLFAQAMATHPWVSTGVYRTFQLRELSKLASGAVGRPAARPHPAADRRARRGHVRRQHQGLRAWAPDLQVEEVPGAGHFVPEEAPDLVVERALALFA